MADYLPEVFAHESRLATLDTIVAQLSPARVEPLLVPSDCTDGVPGAYWRRPDALLDPSVRSAISGLALLDQHVVAAAVNQLRHDLRTGRWSTQYGPLLDHEALDLGYRLVIAGTDGF